jgi:chitin disaccharide deacetylase
VKSLIVNADDLGAGPRRNEGILLAHRRGIVTSASALVQGPGFRHALDLLRSCPTLDAGLHLNLSEGEPLLPGHRTLVGPDGRFWGKEEARRRALQGLFDPREVERETDAQIASLHDAGVRVTHLDGHHHLHVYGVVAEPIARTASRRGLRYVRRPGDTFGVDGPRDERLDEYRRLGQEARKVYEAAGLRSTDHFGGSALSGRLDETTLVETLRSLPDGRTELMVHPGYADAAEGFAGPDRETELRALTAPGLRPLLQDLGVQLRSFETL